MMRIVVDVVFQTWGEAVAAADELRAADYDVLIADDVVDVYSNAAFAEVSTMAGPESADPRRRRRRNDQVVSLLSDYLSEGRMRLRIFSRISGLFSATCRMVEYSSNERP